MGGGGGSQDYFVKYSKYIGQLALISDMIL